MQIEFYKYQGTGNDFVIIDARSFDKKIFTPTKIKHICDRRFGIGADGLMLLTLKEGFDFEMLYFNANGLPGSMCGNGGRCMVAFAQFLGILRKNKAYFWAIDGPHEAVIDASYTVTLKMKAVSVIDFDFDYMFLDTGSPHHIEFVSDLDSYDIFSVGRAIRNNERYRTEGTNVNFVQILEKNHIKVATYERGVEDETLSCGTGVTAAAIAYYLKSGLSTNSIQIDIQTKGGNLQVLFNVQHRSFMNIWLTGPAVQVFKGQVSLGVDA